MENTKQHITGDCFVCLLPIVTTVKKLSQKAKQKEFDRWDKIFKQENPRYNSSSFAKRIGLEI